MWFRSNRPHRFDVHSPVDNPGGVTGLRPQAVDGTRQQIPEPVPPQFGCGEQDLMWPNGFELPVDRQDFLAELNFERHGVPSKSFRREAGKPGRGLSATSWTNQEKEIT